MEKKMDSQRVA